MNIPIPPEAPAPRAQIPGGFAVESGHNAIIMLVQFYGQLLTEQGKRIDILASQLGNEQRERARLSKENSDLRKRVGELTAHSVESAHGAQEDASRLAGHERGRDEGVEPA